MGLYSRLGVHPAFDPSHKFVTSPFLRSPFTLALVRVIVAVYTLLVLIITLIWTTVKLDSGNRCVTLHESGLFSHLLTNPSCFIIIVTSLIFPTSPISGSAPIIALPVLKPWFTPLHGENLVQGLDTLFNAGQKYCRRYT